MAESNVGVIGDSQVLAKSESTWKLETCPQEWNNSTSGRLALLKNVVA